jgi:hypothetical protein
MLYRFPKKQNASQQQTDPSMQKSFPNTPLRAVPGEGPVHALRALFAPFHTVARFTPAACATSAVHAGRFASPVTASFAASFLASISPPDAA